MAGSVMSTLIRRWTWQSESEIAMHTLHTPVGDLAIYLTQSGETHAAWLDADCEDAFETSKPVPPEVVERLGSYLAGEHASFDDIPTPTGSDFYARCWNECRLIPAGETISYGELACRAGSPGAARAAGQAMRNNPLPVIVPCHRVVGSDGKLHGYAGTTSGDSLSLQRKRWLLDLERGSVASHAQKQ